MLDFIFHCAPQRYDLSVLQQMPNHPERWQATRFRREMHPRDGVYFYMSGQKAGIYGCGRISASPDEETRSVSVQWLSLYPAPVTKSELEPLLSENLLFTVRVGTNFLLSAKESADLRALISSKKLLVP